MLCKYIVLHHSATDKEASLEDLANAHVKRGFDEIGYHYIVDQKGEIFAGRSEDREGAHAYGINSESIGVCCIGNFEENTVPEKQMNGLVQIVSDLVNRYSVDLHFIIGHGEIASWNSQATKTLCPGRHLRDAIPEIRERVERIVRSDPEDPCIVFDPSTSGILQIRGELPRASTARLERWNEKKEFLTHIRVTLSKKENERVEWRAWVKPILKNHRAQLNFLLSCPQNALPPGEYQLLVEPCSQDGVIANESGPPFMACDVRLPIKNPYRQNTKPYRAHIVAAQDSGRYPFILKVSGRVLNCGKAAWRNDDEKRPFRIGAILVSGRKELRPIHELRHDFIQSTVEPGAILSFQFTLHLCEFPQGEYFLHIDVLREQGFWFSEIGNKGAVLRIEVPEVPRSFTQGREHLSEPPSSFCPPFETGHLLYIAPTLPLFDRSTGGRRLLDIFRILRARGLNITFLYQQLGTFTSPERYLGALDELGIKHAGDPLGFLSEKEASDYHLCVVGWYTYAATILPAVRELLPGIRVAIDSVDIHWVRGQRALAEEHSPEAEEKWQLEKKKERDVYSRSDEVWVVSEEDQSALAAELPGMKTRVVGIPCEKHAQFLPSITGTRALFVGGFTHPPNESAALWAAEIVRAYNENAEEPIGLDIVGADPPESVKKLHDGEVVSVIGYAPSLDGYYRNAGFLMAPMRYGAGVKGKICEAICRGLPVVTNQIGNEGLGLQHEKEAFLAETTKSFVSCIESILSGAHDIDRLRFQALQKLLSQYGYSSIERQIVSSVTAPAVTIAIVTFNQRELLRRCLQSIFDHTSYPNFKIAVFSNGCSDGTREMLEEYRSRNPRHVDIHLSSYNDYFVRPSNILISSYPHSDIVLMNNDIEVVNRGWLTNLVDAAYSGSRIASAGGKILDPAGNISEAGAEIYSSGFGRNLSRGLPADSPAAMNLRHVGFVSGCLMYMRRDAISIIGSLDEDFHPMYFEDVAWHYTAHHHGWKTMYTPWAIAIHREGSSAGQNTASGMKKFQEINRAKFLKKFSYIVVEEYND